MSEWSRMDEILNHHCITAAQAMQVLRSSGIDPEQWGAVARGQDEVFGVWSPSARTFVYPDFQFCGEDAPVYRRGLLQALSGRVGFDPVTQDRGGWARAYWLYQPNTALSEGALAAVALDFTDPVNAAKHLALISDGPRTPAEVFGVHPQAVVALVQTLAPNRS